MEGDLYTARPPRLQIGFQSTPSAWRETSPDTSIQPPFRFQSTPSAWRETLLHILVRYGSSISIHSLRMEGDRCCFYVAALALISIHSLRMEGDLCFSMSFEGFYISIHSLRMEGDIQHPDIPDAEGTFQSTPSAWRETICANR